MSRSHDLVHKPLAEINRAAFVDALVRVRQQLVNVHRLDRHVKRVLLGSGEDHEHHLSQHGLGADLRRPAQPAEVDVVASLDDVEQAISADQDGGRSDGGEEDAEDGELDRLLGHGADFGDGVDELEEDGVLFGGLDLAADDGEGEELEGAVEGRLDDFGVGGVEGEEERLEDGVSVGGGEAGDDGGGIVGVVGEGLEPVEDGFAGGDEVRVLAPRGVFDDLVEGRTYHAAAACGAAECL